MPPINDLDIDSLFENEEIQDVEEISSTEETPSTEAKLDKSDENYLEKAIKKVFDEPETEDTLPEDKDTEEDKDTKEDVAVSIPEVEDISKVFLTEQFGTDNVEAIKLKQEKERKIQAITKEIDVAYTTEYSNIQMKWADTNLQYANNTITLEKAMEIKKDLELQISKLNDQKASAIDYQTGLINNQYATQEAEQLMATSYDSFMTDIKNNEKLPEGFKNVMEKVVGVMRNEMKDPEISKLPIDQFLKYRGRQMAEIFKAGMDYQAGLVKTAQVQTTAKKRLGTLATKTTGGTGNGSTGLTQEKILSMSSSERAKHLPQYLKSLGLS